MLSQQILEYYIFNVKNDMDKRTRLNGTALFYSNDHYVLVKSYKIQKNYLSS